MISYLPTRPWTFSMLLLRILAWQHSCRNRPKVEQSTCMRRVLTESLGGKLLQRCRCSVPSECFASSRLVFVQSVK
jgi:hypothetical protein